MTPEFVNELIAFIDANDRFFGWCNEHANEVTTEQAAFVIALAKNYKAACDQLQIETVRATIGTTVH